MTKTWKLFKIGFKQITKDGMLLVLLPAPILVGLLFRFVIPLVNGVVEDKYAFSFLPWYGLVDGMLVCLTPMFAAMISSFLLLEERDEGISSFYQITPTGGTSYLVARIGFPMIWAFIMTTVSLAIFKISDISMLSILTSSALSALMGTALAMMVVAMAGNRVEGLAFSKLMGVSFLGLPIVWFVPVPYQYFASFLPSFWIGKIIFTGVDGFNCMAGLISCLVWCFIFIKRFLNRIS